MRIMPRKKDKKKKKSKLMNNDHLKHGHRPSSLYEFAIKEYSNTVLPCQSNDDGSQSHVSVDPASLRVSHSVLSRLYSPPNIIDSPPSNLRNVDGSKTSPQQSPNSLNSSPPLSNEQSVPSTHYPSNSPGSVVKVHSTSPVRVPEDCGEESPQQPQSRRNSLSPFSDHLPNDDNNILKSSSQECSPKKHFSPDNFKTLASMQPTDSLSSRGLPSNSIENSNNTSNNSSLANSNNVSNNGDPNGTISTNDRTTERSTQAQYSDCSSPSSFQETATSISRRYHIRQQSSQTLHEPEMPDSTYEEYYGDAYVNKPIRYIYPTGYGNMRPRSFPWKISVIICGSFTWLTVFIVGHCSDQVNWDNYDYYGMEDGQEMDDEVVIATRWCGSRALYFMWVLSVLITGLACSYCSIIGYIKARDFAVANGRSQPPGMAGKSDFYVRIHEQSDVEEQGDGTGGGGGGGDNGKRKEEPTITCIYQSDGTPRFLGGQIYRPTQAAVHLTSR